MNRSGSVRQHLVVWSLILGVWGLLVIAFAAQLMFSTGLSWDQAFRFSLRDWSPWALLAPAVAWIALKFPLEKKELALSIPVHLAACMLAVVTCEFISRPQAPVGPPGGGAGPLRWRGEGPEGPIPLRQGREFPPLQTGARDANRPPPEVRHVAFLNTLVMRGKFNIPIYWIIVSIVHAVAYHRKSEERERRAAELEATLAETRVQALRMQLHPHFLFNTLNAISTLVHRDPGAADEMIANLSELLRTTLDTTEQEIALQRELQLLDRYLEIQQMRFGDRLRIERQIDPVCLNAKVPTFVLQPLAENALRHGIEPKPGPGLVRITASRSGNSLQLLVQDNGPGITPTPKDRPGVGLANTKARLQALYGNRARLQLRGAPGGGCKVEVELPWAEAGSAKPAPAVSGAEEPVSSNATRSNENQNTPD